MLFGVAGGMADYFNVDSTVVRLIWVLLFLAVGAGVLLYIAAAILIPEAPEGEPGRAYRAGGAADQAAGPGGPAAPGGARPAPWGGESGGAILLGLLLVVVGAWFLVSRFIRIDGSVLWPALLLVVGLILVVGSMRRQGR
jgi:phage shock protein PspC (stress-responsive transcriptional regulator)